MKYPLYHDFERHPSKDGCAVCSKNRLSAFHMLPDGVDANLSKRIRELPKEAWRIRKKDTDN